MNKIFSEMVKEAAKKGVIVRVRGENTEFSINGVKYEKAKSGFLRFETEDGNVYTAKDMEDGWLICSLKQVNSITVLQKNNMEDFPHIFSIAKCESEKSQKIRRILCEIHSVEDSIFDVSMLLWFDFRLCENPYIFLSQFDEKTKYVDSNGKKRVMNQSVMLLDMVRKLERRAENAEG